MGIIKHLFKTTTNVEPASQVQAAKRNATREILEALMNGRHLSQMDCHEFQVEDMRTPISHLKGRYSATHNLNSKWITTPVRNARIKEYWLEAK